MDKNQPYNFTTHTLAELLGHSNSTIQRHAMGILKELMKVQAEKEKKDFILARNSITARQ